MRLSRRFADAFANAEKAEPANLAQGDKAFILHLCEDLKVRSSSLLLACPPELIIDDRPTKTNWLR